MKRLRRIVFVIMMMLFVTGCSVNIGEGDESKDDLSNTIIENEIEYKNEENSIETQEADGHLEVHYIDVGQADATLIICEDEAMLIDGGNVNDSSLIYSYLKERNITHLEYIICTHAHEDHVGGLAGALNLCTVEKVYCPVDYYDSEAFGNFLKYLYKQKKDITIPIPGEKFDLGGSECQILGVNTLAADDSNNSSIVIKLKYKETEFLFSGDAEQTVEKEILDSDYNISCDVLKVPHHGSSNSLSYRWLRESMPEYAIISVGKENSYGHPTDDVLSKLRDAEVTVFRTDLQGHIICLSDGYTLTFTTEKNYEGNTILNNTDGVLIDNSITSDKSNEMLDTSVAYILNVNTKKIHYPYCSSVSQMKEKNKQESSLSRNELIQQGYTPCGNCKP